VPYNQVVENVTINYVFPLKAARRAVIANLKSVEASRHQRHSLCGTILCDCRAP